MNPYLVNVSSEVQQFLGKNELVIITERVDDVVLLIGQMIRMGLPEILDKHIPRRGKPRELSWGWTATIWLAYILSEGDHRKVSMAQYVEGMSHTLSTATNRPIEALDFDDDRLSHLLKHLGKRQTWRAVEHDLNVRSLEVYELPRQVVRCDPTTVSGYHTVKEGGLMQFGHSKDDPTRPQIKLAVASLDPLGMPLVTEVVSGETADDGLYAGLIERVDASLNQRGLLFVGDCKMSALETRLDLVTRGHYYLSPLPLTGKTAQAMPEWIQKGLEKDRDGALESIHRESEPDPKGKAGRVEVARAYELERTQEAGLSEGTATWQERVLVVHSPAHARRQEEGLEQRLRSARQEIEALTPPVGRGKRQITEEGRLTAAITGILKKHRVAGLLQVEHEVERESQTRYVGKGRGSAQRERQVIEKIRCQIQAVRRDEEAILAARQGFGWKAFATNTDQAALSLSEAVLGYRNEFRIERIFHRLKSRVDIAPLFVKRDDQIEGLTYLLTLGMRVLTLTEFVVRRALRADQAKLPGLHPENRKKETDQPTAERILKAFSGITLTIFQDSAGNQLFRWLTPLSEVQLVILKCLGLENAYAPLQNSG
jgi:transposase